MKLLWKYGTADMQVRTARLPYTVTSQDAAKNYVVVNFVWDIPFEDANYTVVLGVEDLSATPGLDYHPGDMHSKTAQGVTAYFGIDPAGKAGDSLLLHAMDIHD